ncbi:MAG: hypothetical protein ACJ768_04205 [Gaiellaceae bacterium]
MDHGLLGNAAARRLLAVVAGAAIACLAAASPALAGPVWRIDSLSNTTALAGTDAEYVVQVTNVGDASTDGSQIVLTARLPPGMTVAGAKLEGRSSGNTYPCTAGDGVSPVVGAQDLRCVNPDVVPRLGVNGNYQVLFLKVHVQSGVTGTLTSSFAVSGGGAVPDSTVDPTRVQDDPIEFGIDAFDGEVVDAAGAPYTKAGGHPYAASVWIDFNTVTNPNPLAGPLWPIEPVRDVLVDLPPGFVGDPTAADRCTTAELAHSDGLAALPLCPVTSQIGTTVVKVNASSVSGANIVGPLPVFNMVPPPGVPARFGFNALGSMVVLDARVRTGGDYGISVDARNIPEALAITGTEVTFWGVPASPSHDADRSCPGDIAPAGGGASCSVRGVPQLALLRNPTSCPPAGVGLPTTAHIDSWINPGDFKDATWFSHLQPGYPFAPEDWGPQQGTTECDKVPFEPKLNGAPVSARAGSPSAFTFDLSIPQTNDPLAIASADLKRAVVTLPAGVHVSASSADGLAACAPDQIRLHDASSPSCPDAAKIGSATIDTPLLEDPVQGSVYLALPHDNPFGTLLSVYLVAEGSGVVVKVAGEVHADPITGQLTATFDDNPQTPFSNLRLRFDGGPRAPLVVPRECGTYTTHAELTAWSGKTVPYDSSFTVSGDGAGGPCAAPRFAPRFTAETTRPVAGATSTFNVAISREDADQQLGRVDLTMPRGLTAKIANATLCQDAQAQAGACPESSRVGSVTAGAGAGPDPFYIHNGRAYLTGPYKGAPFGLSIVVPAVAGPFDLGNVTVRSAVSVDKHDATVRVVTDPLPTILEGIPLDVRDVRVSADKPGFFLNPTSCASKTVSGVLESIDGARAAVSSRFQVGECANLALKPQMRMRVGGRGHTRRGQTTPFRTTLTMPQRGQTNLRSVQVTLPRTINARLTVINDACTRAEFETDVSKCAHARAGSAVASTPLLRDSLKGNVYFVKNGNPIPDLFVALRGQVDFDLIGRVTIPGGTRLSTTFPAAPDVPIRSFSLSLLGDTKNGSVGAAANLCSRASRRKKVELDYIGQNGKVRHVEQALTVAGCGKQRAKKPHRSR